LLRQMLQQHCNSCCATAAHPADELQLLQQQLLTRPLHVWLRAPCAAALLHAPAAEFLAGMSTCSIWCAINGTAPACVCAQVRTKVSIRAYVCVCCVVGARKRMYLCMCTRICKHTYTYSVSSKNCWRVVNDCRSYLMSLNIPVCTCEHTTMRTTVRINTHARARTHTHTRTRYTVSTKQCMSPTLRLAHTPQGTHAHTHARGAREQGRTATPTTPAKMLALFLALPPLTALPLLHTHPLPLPPQPHSAWLHHFHPPRRLSFPPPRPPALCRRLQLPRHVEKVVYFECGLLGGEDLVGGSIFLECRA